MAVGVGCYVGMASLYLDLQGERKRYFAAQRLADLVIDVRRAPLGSLEEVRKLPNVRAARGRVNVQVLIDLAGRDAPISGRAISMPTERRPVINDVLLRTGSWFSGRSEGEAILNHDFAAANGLRPGDRLRVTLEDRRHELTVIGTAMSPEFVYLLSEGSGLAPDPANFGVLYLDERFLRERTDQTGAANQVVGLVHDASPAAIERTLDRAKELLDAYGVINTAQGRDQPAVRFLTEKMKGMKAGTTFVPLVFLLVAALILNVLLGRLVREQRSVIGTLRALGLTAWDIRRHFLAYGLLVGVLGGGLGIAWGLWLQRAMGAIFLDFYSLPSLPSDPRADVISRAVVVSLAFGILGALRGVRTAARLQPAEAMRPPPPEMGRQTPIERLPGFGRLSFRVRIALRSILRNPIRSALTVVATCLATALLTSTLQRLDAIDYLMRHEFELASHQDLTVVLRDPVDRDGPRELEQLRGVGQTEPQLLVPCEIRRGPLRKRLGVTGIPQGNSLYTPLDRSARKLRIPRQGLVLSRKLAEMLETRVGHTLVLRTLLGERRTVRVPVVAIADTYLGVSAYADIDFLSGLVGESWATNAILARVAPSPVREGVLKALEQRRSVISIAERSRGFAQIQETLGATLAVTLGFLVLFAGLIAFGAVLNTALVALSERRREVGTLRVLGYTPAQVAAVFAGEALLLGLIGIALGVFMGIGMNYGIAVLTNTELFRLPIVVRPQATLIGTGLVLVFVLLAQVELYRRITRLDWLSVLQVKE